MNFPIALKECRIKPRRDPGLFEANEEERATNNRADRAETEQFVAEFQTTVKENRAVISFREEDTTTQKNHSVKKLLFFRSPPFYRCSGI